MKNRVWRCAVLGLVTAGMMLHSCSVSYAYSGSAYLYHQTSISGEQSEVNPLTQILKKVKEQEASVTGQASEYIPDSRFLVTGRIENDIRVTSMAGQCMLEAGKDWIFYVIGKDYMPEGSALAALFGGQMEYSATLEESFRWMGNDYALVRFAVKAVSESGNDSGNDAGNDTGNNTGRGSVSRRYWSIGDVVTRTIDGIDYSFRCIDQNYGEGTMVGQGLALFLCDSVITADTGSEYTYGRREDGSYGYIFQEGPIVNFGDSSEYKDSRIRSWLTALEDHAMQSINVGVKRSCMGQTTPLEYSRFDQSPLKFYDLGSQILMDRYFILSVDEALKYRKHLWIVDGDSEEAAGENTSAFGKGYWLRTPMGTASGTDTGYVYVVDLVNGNIRPEPVKPLQESGDGELAVTSSIGVRPAFVLEQEG